jgi:hypothetical protein
MSGTLTAGSVTNLSAEELNQETITATDTYSASHLDIGTIDATAGIDQSTITSAGNIGTIKSLFVQNSLISAATADPSPSGTAGSDDFTAPAIIQSVDIQKTGNFANSTITAYKVGSLNLSQISGGGGIAAEEFGSVGGISPAGELDRVTFILHSGALRSPAKLQAALHQLNIACTTVTGEPDITVFYDLDLTILT